MSQISIWGVGTTRTFRVHWMLAELGLAYETKRIESRTGEARTPEYTALNPRQKIPMMVHGNIVLTESYAIMHYLRSLNDNMPFDDYQQSVAGRAMYDQWLSFLLMELDATSLYVVRRHKDLHEIYGEAPATVASSLAYFERMVTSVADEIQPDKPIWGSCFSELDILLTIALDWGTLLECNLPECAIAYREFMRGRPAYRSARLHNFRDLQLPTAPTS